MKITVNQLRKIINEEVGKALSEAPASVSLKGMSLATKRGMPLKVVSAYVTAMDSNFGELRLGYDPKAFMGDPSSLYGDMTLLKNLRKVLLLQGMSPAAAADVDFSEQGMQGRDFVSLDVGEAFISEWPEVYYD